MFSFMKNFGRMSSRSNRKSGRSRRRCSFEGLENRQLFSVASVSNGVLYVEGNDGVNDKIEIVSDATTEIDTDIIVKVTNRDTGLETYRRTFDQRDFERMEVRGLGGDDVIINDLFRASRLFGGDGNDVLYGCKGTEVNMGYPSEDELYGGGGSDVLYGRGGNDTLVGGDPERRGTGGIGDISIGGFSVGDLSVGADGNDTLDGGDGDDKLYGGIGDDKLYGSAGNDRLYGGDGNDTIDGGAGDDYLSGQDGDDTYRFGPPVRRFNVHAGPFTRFTPALGNDTIDDSSDVNAGRDTLDFSAYGKGINVDLAEVDRFTVASGLTLQIDQASPIENVIGTAFNDVISGNSRPNTLKGMGGNDELSGRDGNDYLDGGLGNDDISGGAGVDQLFGGAGENILVGGSDRDYFHFRSNGGEDEYDTLPDWFDAGDALDFSEYDYGVTLNLNIGKDTDQFVAEHLRLKIYHPWTVTDVLGTQQIDYIEGNDRANYINGEGGNDTIKGHDGNDTLYGGAGYDKLYGNDGNDTLNGGDDDIEDFLVGGSGHDTFWAEWEYTAGTLLSSDLVTRLRRNLDKPSDYDAAFDQIANP